jgi:hypothetical protein
MAQYLVVAHRTLLDPHLLDEVRRRIDEGPSVFHLVVPVHHPRDHPWSQGEVEARARERLEEGLSRFRELGAEAEGEVGDVDPVSALKDAVGRLRIEGREFDEVILSTQPPGPSRWLGLDVVTRARRAVDIPVTHVVAGRVPAGG